MLGVVYWQSSHNGTMPEDDNIIIKSVTTAGTVFGAIVFGYLADVVGRKKMYGMELVIIISTTLAQALCSSSVALNVASLISFWRFMTGIGVGGDYPLSAVITSEMADTKWRGGMISAVFAMQGFGQFFAAIMSFIVAVSFKGILQQTENLGDCTDECLRTVDIMWRIVLGFGGVPGWFALYYRLTIPETPRYTFDVKYDPEKAAADSRRLRTGNMRSGKADKLKQTKARLEMRKYRRPLPSIGEFCRYFRNRKHFLFLLGTSASWFFVDVAFYGMNLNTSTILTKIGFSGEANVYQYLKNAAVGQLVLVCAGQIPGYLLTVVLVDIVGRKPIQIGGFMVLTLIFTVIGFSFQHLNQMSLLALFIVAQFFFNFGKTFEQPLRYPFLLMVHQGPNATTFIVPSEIFPTRVRATAYGVSAAGGKIGALIAQYAINPLATKGGTTVNPYPWINRLMLIYALFMLCGLFTSFLIPETKCKTLEELAGESEHSPAYELNFVNNFIRHDTPNRRREAKSTSSNGREHEILRISD